MGRLTQVVRVHNWQVCEFGGFVPKYLSKFCQL